MNIPPGRLFGRMWRLTRQLDPIGSLDNFPLGQSSQRRIDARLSNLELRVNQLIRQFERTALHNTTSRPLRSVKSQEDIVRIGAQFDRRPSGNAALQALRSQEDFASIASQFEQRLNQPRPSESPACDWLTVWAEYRMASEP